MPDDTASVEVTRRVEAPPAAVFNLLTQPRRHAEFDGSGMLRGPLANDPIRAVGDTFTMRMHRLGRDYEMINHVVAFERDRLLLWEPAPGDLDTAGGDPARIGVPSGYRWGYRLSPDGEHATVLTSVFECGAEANRWILEDEGGTWINGHTTVRTSMEATVARIAAICDASGDQGAGSGTTS